MQVKGKALHTNIDYDALIIGGRAAGGSLAVLLAQRGYRVMAVDRDRFPSDTMSTHYMHSLVVPLLDKLGVLADLDAAGFRHMTRCRIYLDDCVFEGPMEPSGLGFALAPRRDVLDELLIQRAVEHGAEFAQGTRAERLIYEDGRVVGAELRDSDGERREVRARVVVGADGKFSSVAKWVGAESYNEVTALRPLYYGHFRGIEPLPEPAVELFYGGNRMGLLFPMRPGEDCLALELQPEDFERFRVDPTGEFNAFVDGLYGMRGRMRHATLDGNLIGVKGIDNYLRKPFGPGWALTGDASYLKDPSTGTGIGDALQQAFWLADALDDYFRGADWDARLSEFQQMRDQTVMPMLQSTISYTKMRDPNPETIALLRAGFSAPGPARVLAYALPQAMSQILPPPLMARVQQISETLRAQREPADVKPVQTD